MGRLDGKVALISGGARGQGAAEAELFAKEGASVVFGDILDELGRGVEAKIHELGGEARYMHLDVTIAADWQAAVQLAVSSYGKLNILINNAGIVYTASIEDTPEEEWDRVMAVNAKGAFLGTKYSVSAMKQAGGGSIVNISSALGITASPNKGAYTASKGAVRLFSKATAIQHGGDNIRCNSVHPGSVDTPMLAESAPGVDLSQLPSRYPLNRIATALDIAYGVLYLASDESSFVTGTDLIIDGGRTAQ